MTTNRSPQPARRRLGFSFVEVLFAVMVLGVGFIMIAAIFPVAIRQAQGTVEETTAARVLVNAEMTLPNLVTVDNADPTNVDTLDPLLDNFNYTTGAAGTVGAYFSARDPRQPAAVGTTLWDRTKGSFIDKSDPRMAWTFLYRRDLEAVTKDPQLLFAVTTVRNRPTYDSRDLFRYDSTTGTPDDADEEQPWATLQPKLIRVILINQPDGTDTVEVLPAARTAPTPALNLTRVGGGNVPTDEVPNYTSVVGEGSLIVVSDDNVLAPYSGAPFSTSTPYLPGTANGRVYRVGDLSDIAPTAGGTVWNLIPNGDLASDKESLPPDSADRTDAQRSAIAFVFGRGYIEVTKPDYNLNDAIDVEDVQGRVQDVHVRQGSLQ